MARPIRNSRMPRLICELVPLLAAAAPLGASAPGSLDPTFDPGSGANAQVKALALQPDGKVLVAGDFTQFSGVPRARLARLEADGRLDPGFDVAGGPNGKVRALAVLHDGRILVGGTFTEWNRVPRRHLALLNRTGTLEAFDAKVETSTQASGSTASAEVRALAVQPDGKILVGGSFALADGRPRHGLARLNPGGDLDQAFDPGLEPGSAINAIALQTNGKINIIGFFNEVRGVARRMIARLNSDGTLDTSFQPQLAFDEPGFEAASVTPDGKLVVGGQFGSFRGGGFKLIARLNSDGSVDSDFQIGAGRQSGPGFASDRVNSMALQSDGKIVVGGWIHSLNGVPRSGIARLLPSGDLDSTFPPGSGVTDGSVSLPGPTPSSVDSTEVTSVLIQSDGRILLAGDFTKVNGVPRNYVARLVGELAGENAISLSIARVNNGLTLSWPASATGVVLEETSTLGPGTRWMGVTAVPRVVQGEHVVSIAGIDAAKFYRLKRR